VPLELGAPADVLAPLTFPLDFFALAATFFFDVVFADLLGTTGSSDVAKLLG